jgi:hypothetical protein
MAITSMQASTDGRSVDKGGISTSLILKKPEAIIENHGDIGKDRFWK